MKQPINEMRNFINIVEGDIVNFTDKKIRKGLEGTKEPTPPRTVKLSNGKTVDVWSLEFDMGFGPEDFEPGERVDLIKSGDTVNVECNFVYGKDVDGNDLSEKELNELSKNIPLVLSLATVQAWGNKNIHEMIKFSKIVEGSTKRK